MLCSDTLMNAYNIVRFMQQFLEHACCISCDFIKMEFACGYQSRALLIVSRKNRATIEAFLIEIEVSSLCLTLTGFHIVGRVLQKSQYFALLPIFFC